MLNPQVHRLSRPESAATANQFAADAHGLVVVSKASFQAGTDR